MKSFKWLSLAVLLVSAVIFGSYTWKDLKSKDNLGPVITMDEEQIYVSIKDGEDVLLQGVTAVDSRDGDVTDSLVVESISGFVEGNKRYVNYAAFDSNNHVTKAARKAVYTDYTPIRFSIEEPLRFAMTNGSSIDILSLISAEDCIDGDISDHVNFSTGGEVYLYIAGDYETELQVTNSAGDTATLPVTITIYDQAVENSAPKIALSKYIVYTKVGKSLDPLKYLDTVTWRGTEYSVTEERGTFNVDTSEMGSDEKKAFQEEQQNNPSVSYDKFTITDPTDYQTAGVYEIHYSLKDSDENIGSVNLIVVVEEE